MASTVDAFVQISEQTQSSAMQVIQSAFDIITYANALYHTCTHRIELSPLFKTKYMANCKFPKLEN